MKAGVIRYSVIQIYRILLLKREGTRDDKQFEVDSNIGAFNDQCATISVIAHIAQRKLFSGRHGTLRSNISNVIIFTLATNKSSNSDCNAPIDQPSIYHLAIHPCPEAKPENLRRPSETEPCALFHHSQLIYGMQLCHNFP